MVFAIAAVSLDLILGYGGMVSASATPPISGSAAMRSASSPLRRAPTAGCSSAAAIGASALVALVIGAMSLRTSGVYFVMITLAFAQMLYFLFISLKVFGGDDGMSIHTHSEFSGLIDLADPVDLLLPRARAVLGSLFWCTAS